MIARNVTEIVADHMRLTVESIDRMYLNVYVPQLQCAYGAVDFFRDHSGQPLAYSALMAPMSRGFVAELERFATRHGLPVVRASEFRAQKRHSSRSGRAYPWIVKSTAMVNHYYIYAVDWDFGPFFRKFCSFFPYNVKSYLNGHEYAKRHLSQQAIAFQALDNAVLSCADPDRLQRICDGSAGSTACCANGGAARRTRSRPRTKRPGAAMTSRSCEPSFP